MFKWLAIDDFGTIFLYEDKPIYDEDAGEWIAQKSFRCKFIDYIENPPVDPQLTLIELSEKAIR